MATNILVESVYQKLANEYNSSVSYVGKIARGERKPQHKNSKGMLIKKAIDKLLEEQKRK